jgi:hypothetical protein
MSMAPLYFHLPLRWKFLSKHHQQYSRKFQMSFVFQGVNPLEFWKTYAAINNIVIIMVQLRQHEVHSESLSVAYQKQQGCSFCFKIKNNYRLPAGPAGYLNIYS